MGNIQQEEHVMDERITDEAIRTEIFQDFLMDWSSRGQPKKDLEYWGREVFLLPPDTVERCIQDFS